MTLVTWQREAHHSLGQLTHEEIAPTIGSSRETVTRLFSDFKRKQLVQVKGSTVIIKNKAGLESLLTLH
ncbi:MAG TPA: helix-turn-helix domain-containing protein [Candidatus Sulfotelmatobacter sp.]|nr:helix-turn-helix domain-containing protein [Candidatus Sulfotelmatobacter sp.]